MGDVVVVGGGCYGSFYAAQLAKAKQRGRARFRRVVVVDRDPACRARRELGDAPDRAIARGYHALKDDGKGIQRSVYVVRRDGKVAFAQRGAPPVDEIVASAP